MSQHFTFASGGIVDGARAQGANDAESHALKTRETKQPPDVPQYEIVVVDSAGSKKRGRNEREEDEAGSPPTESEPKRHRVSPEAAALQKKQVNNEQWDLMFAKLVKFKETWHCMVPKRYGPDPKLGTWVETQRNSKKKLERSMEGNGAEAPASASANKRLGPDRLAKLEAIGFAWSGKKAVSSPIIMNSSSNSASTRTNMNPSKQKRSAHAEDALAKTTRNRLNDDQWEDFFQRLKTYRDKMGDCLVPRKYEADPKLATWVETQRALWNRDFKQQQHQQSEAKANTGVVGASCESPKATTSDVMEIGKMTATSNTDVATDTSHPAGKAPVVTDGLLMDTATGKLPARRLTQERKDRLQALGFVWSLRHKRIEDHWDLMFSQLVEYKNKVGDCLVPSRFEENPKLGKWVETQRYEYTKLQRVSGAEAGKVAEETAATVVLTETGENVASANPGAPISASNKARASNPRLTEERIRRLESIGFEWKVRHKMKRYYDRQWDAMLERLLAFKETHGHVLVPKRWPPDMKLGQWVHTQRISYRKLVVGTANKVGDVAELDASGEIKSEEVSYRLTEERRKKLEDIGFVWSPKESEKGLGETGKITRNSYDQQWDLMFQRLAAYKERRGHCLVPKRCKEEPKLGTWCDTQRVQKKKLERKLAELGDGNATASSKPIVGRLTDDRISRLESIGFTWSLRDDWQKHYTELHEYKAEHGHCNVPARYSVNRRLGIWVSAQRQQYKLRNKPQDPSKPKKSPLTDERIRLLSDMGFVWAVRSRDSTREAAKKKGDNNDNLQGPIAI